MMKKKSFMGTKLISNKRLDSLIEKYKDISVTDDELVQQSVNFAYRNASEKPSLTKAAVEKMTRNIRLSA